MLPYFQAERDFVVAHWQAIIFGLIVLASVLNRLLPGHPYLSGFTRQVVSFLAATPMAGARSAIFAFLASKLGDGLTSAFFDWLSKWLDIPVLSKSVHPEDSGSNVTGFRGYAHLGVLVVLAILCTSFAVLADDPPRAVPVLPLVAASDPPPTPPLPARLVGGCNKPGTICFGPSLALTLTAWDLTHSTVVAGFNPGIGYGVTFFAGRWYSSGLDYFLSMQTGPESGINQALMVKLANGYVRVGVARQLLGDKKSWLIPVGFGVDL